MSGSHGGLSGLGSLFELMLLCLSIPFWILGACAIAMLVIFTRDVPTGFMCASTVVNGTTVTAGGGMDLSIYTWVVVSAAISLFIAATLMVFLVFRKSDWCDTVDGIERTINFVYVLIPIIMIFMFAWNIVGSVLYWRDCQGNLPSEDAEKVVKARLILSYILLLQ
jgi:hypothetical protein